VVEFDARFGDPETHVVQGGWPAQGPSRSQQAGGSWTWSGRARTRQRHRPRPTS